MTRDEVDTAIRDAVGFIPTGKIDAASNLIERLAWLLADEPNEQPRAPTIADYEAMHDHPRGGVVAMRLWNMKKRLADSEKEGA